MGELRDEELGKIAGGARPETNPQQGLNTAWEQQGYPTPDEGKSWNGTKGLYPAAENAGFVVGGGKTITAASRP